MMPARFHNSATVCALKSFQMSADENRFMSNTRVERVWRFHCWCTVPHFCLMLYYPVTPPNTKILYNFSITFAGNRDSCHICPFNMFCMQMVQYLNAGHVFQLVIYRWATTKKNSRSVHAGGGILLVWFWSTCQYKSIQSYFDWSPLSQTCQPFRI